MDSLRPRQRKGSEVHQRRPQPYARAPFRLSGALRRPLQLRGTPAESTAYRLAKHDVEKYPDIITASDGTPYYTNSSHLPVGYTDDIFSALDIQDELQTLYTSGTVFHAFLGEKLPDWKSAANLVRKIAENYRLPYYTLSPTYSVCRNHGYLTGEQTVCPHCGEPTETYSRITGYYRPVKAWNDGKAQEFKDRKTYDIANSVLRRNGVESKVEMGEAKSEATVSDGAYLFTTATCPNCKVVKSMLDKMSYKYETLLANENRELCEAFDIRQAPTLVIVKDGSLEKYAGVSDIKKHATVSA